MKSHDTRQMDRTKSKTEESPNIRGTRQGEGAGGVGR